MNTELERENVQRFYFTQWKPCKKTNWHLYNIIGAMMHENLQDREFFTYAKHFVTSTTKTPLYSEVLD